MRFFVGFLLFVSLPLHAAIVDCTGATPGAYTTISAALAALPATGPQTISVSGTCTENVVVRSRNDLTIEGNPTATIQAAAGTTLFVRASVGLVLRRLTIEGTPFALHVQDHSTATLEAVTLGNAGTALIVDTRSSVIAGGNSPSRAVLIHDSNYGVIADEGSFTANGYVTIEDNNNGIDAETSRLVFIGSAAGPNIIRNTAFNAIFMHANSNIDFRGTNTISDNGGNGILAFEGSTVDVIGPTTIDGNGRSGVALIFNSSGRVQNATVTNNGSAGDPLSSGVTASNNGSVIVSGSTITGNLGTGVFVDAGGFGRVSTSTITGNTVPMKLATGGIVEIQNGNTFAGKATCDDSVVLYGTGAGDLDSDCKKTK